MGARQGRAEARESVGQRHRQGNVRIRLIHLHIILAGWWVGIFQYNIIKKEKVRLRIQAKEDTAKQCNILKILAILNCINFRN